SPSRIAGTPGRTRRTSSPWLPSTTGSAPTTSARPPVFRSGKISAAACRTLIRPDATRSQPLQHRTRDQGDAVGTAIETRGIQVRILADHQSVGDAAAVIDDGPGEARVPA